MNKTRSIFIAGIKTVFCNLRLDAMEEGESNINEGSGEDLASWLVNMKTGAGKAMFARIHEASNGLVELYVTPDNHKEAIDWARLATSEIAKELSDQSMEEVFIDPEDAYNQLALNPDWKPHTLAQRVEHLTPSKSPHQARRRTPVAITYAAANAEKPPAKENTARVKKDLKGSVPSTTPTKATAPATNTANNLAWAIPSNTATTREAKAPTKPSIKTAKTGANKYKIATAVQDHRMDKIEATLEGLIEKGTPATNVDPRIENLEKSIAAIAQAQDSSTEAIKKVISGQGEAKKTAKKLAKTVLYNKIQADEDHKIMTHAIKLFQESLIQSQTMINALQRGKESPTTSGKGICSTGYSRA
jgi:hypothetical protein